jgi:basic membrane protein A
VTDVGGLHDRSFNQLAWKGLVAARREYGIKILNAQSRVEADYAKYLRRVAQHYATLIIAVGFSMSHAVYDVAQLFPQQRFVMVDAWPQDPAGREVELPNVESILFKEQESGYLAGVLAGLMEKGAVGRARHNTIGYIGGAFIPAVEHYLAGYVAGARKVDPTVHIVGEYAGTFFKPKVGARIAEKQITKGVDTLFQVAGETGAGYLAVARQRHLYGIGADIDESYLGPFVITSAIKHVDVAVRDEVGLALRRGFRAGIQRFGSATGATGIAAPSRLVPRVIVREELRYETRVRDGALVPPQSIPER